MPLNNAFTWKQFIKNLAPTVKFGRPATERQIAAVEQALGVRFPAQLRDVLREADGVTGKNGHGPIWPLAQIKEQNRQFRTTDGFRELYMPFDHLLFFGTDVNGDQFHVRGPGRWTDPQKRYLHLGS